MKKIICLVALTSTLIGVAAETNLTAAIEKGTKFLLSKQASDGHWGDPQMPALTALPVWALSTAAVEHSNIPNNRTILPSIRKASAILGPRSAS